MDSIEIIATIATVIVGTMLTRFLPFILFPQNKQRPAFLDYLGKQLPLAILGMLVIYCIKDISFNSGNHGTPELISILLIIIIHLKFRQMLYSIMIGTVFYLYFINYF